MKKNLVYFLSAVVLLASCSTAYKTSQTPDDVYYSPGKKIITADAADRYETYPSSSDDNYLRMKARNYDKWNTLDDYNYWYDSRYYYNNYYSPYTSSYLSLGQGWGLGSFYPYYSLYTPYWYNPWSTWNSPYNTVVYYKNPSVYYKPVRNNTNFSSYGNRSYNNNNMPLQSNNRSNVNSNRNNRGNDNYYVPRQNNNNTNYNSNPVRTFNSGSSSSGSGGGGSRVSGGGSRVRP